MRADIAHALIKKRYMLWFFIDKRIFRAHIGARA